MEITKEQQTLLDTQFPPEIEKLAEAQLASLDAVEALREYGASMAEEMLMSYADGSDELLKTASENKTALTEKVEAALKTVGENSYEAEAELTEEQLGEALHKEAQAAGYLIAEGFFAEINSALQENPELVKEAAKAGFMKKVQKAVGKHSAKMGEHLEGAKKAIGAKYKAVMKSKPVAHVKKHKASYAGAAGLAAGAGVAHAAHEHGKK
jgi:hypothetical protein